MIGIAKSVNLFVVVTIARSVALLLIHPRLKRVVVAKRSSAQARCIALTAKRKITETLRSEASPSGEITSSHFFFLPNLLGIFPNPGSVVVQPRELFT